MKILATTILARSPTRIGDKSTTIKLAEQAPAPTGRRSFSSRLTRWGQKEELRRQTVLSTFYDLIRKGLTHPEAAKELRTSVVTIWRWRTRGVGPRTQNCGRHSSAERFQISDGLLARICVLYAAGRRTMAKEIIRRQAMLWAFDAMVRNGANQRTAAAQLRRSSTSFWRWKKRIEPQTFLCGRKPATKSPKSL